MHASLRKNKVARSNASTGQANSAPRKRRCQIESRERLASSAARAGLTVTMFLQQCATANNTGPRRQYSSSSVPASDYDDSRKYGGSIRSGSSRY